MTASVFLFIFLIKKGKDNPEVSFMPRATHKGALSFGMVYYYKKSR